MLTLKVIIRVNSVTTLRKRSVFEEFVGTIKSVTLQIVAWISFMR